MGLHSVTGCPELHVFWGKRGHLTAVEDKWCRWVISLGSVLLEARMRLHSGPAAGERAVGPLCHGGVAGWWQ